MKISAMPSPVDQTREDILTASGHYFDFRNPSANVITIEDIAHALSHLCRFNGHCREFYSVAQHSVNVSYLVPAEDALAGLLHDAAEAYIGDVTRPLKKMIPQYKAIESEVEAAVFAMFGLPALLPKSVKHADLVMLATEQRDLMPAHDDDWACLANIRPIESRLSGKSPIAAKQQFLDRFDLLTRHQVQP